MRIRDIMKTDIVTVTPEMSIVDLDQLMMNERISGAPVVSTDGELVGMVSKTDVIRALSEDFVTLDRPAAEVTIAEIMTPSIIAAEADDGVAKVAQQMLRHSVHRVLVYDHGKLVGLATTFDMLHAVTAFAPDATAALQLDRSASPARAEEAGTPGPG